VLRDKKVVFVRFRAPLQLYFSIMVLVSSVEPVF
jgi:hypothetical protein